MFFKKEEKNQLPSSHLTQLNHQFFLMVRDMRYQEAYQLGTAIINQEPNNQSVAKFCKFIKENQTQLHRMVQEEQKYESDEEQDEDDENDEDESQEQNQIQSITSQSSQYSKEKSQNKSKSKQNLKLHGKQNKYKDHICKIPNCKYKQ